MSRITWEGDQTQQEGFVIGETNGFRAKVLVFSISLRPDRMGIRSSTPYLLAHRLPFRGIERKFGTLAEAQKHAERYLVYAFDLMGFVPKEDSE